MNKHSITPADVIGELHPLFEPILWVAQARSSDESRHVLTMIQIKTDKKRRYTIAATDGRRLHVAEFDPGLFDSDFDALDPGLYEVIAKGKKFIVIAAVGDAPAYPNWKEIVGEVTAGFYESHVDPRTIAHVCMKSGVILDPDFLAEAIGFGTAYKKGETVSVRFGTTGKGPGMHPLKITHEIGTAYVMPMKEPETNDAVDDGADEKPFTPEIPGFTEEN